MTKTLENHWPNILVRISMASSLATADFPPPPPKKKKKSIFESVAKINSRDPILYHNTLYRTINYYYSHETTTTTAKWYICRRHRARMVPIEPNFAVNKGGNNYNNILLYHNFTTI